jgi:hypothetical protein
MAEPAAGQPRKVWVVTFCEGGVAQEPQVYETEKGAASAIEEYAEACHAVWDQSRGEWDFSAGDDDARIDEVPVLPGFLVR